MRPIGLQKLETLETYRFPAIVLLAIIVILSAGCETASALNDRRFVESEVRSVLNQQMEDWNRGDIVSFMKGYSAAKSTRFASGGRVLTGWESVLARYKRTYPDSATMGQLTFSDVDIAVLSRDAALVFGHWRLKRDTDEPSGLFTLVFRKSDAGWRIVHDHTSSDANE